MLEIIHKPKSVRQFTDKEVSREQVEQLIRAGMAAPSARNMQPWAFVAVDERILLDQLGEGLPYAKMCLKATAAIAVCGDLSNAMEGEAREYWIQDCSAATQNILLAAESMGLGAVWTAVHPRKERIEVVRRILQLPDHIIPLNVIPLGYPAGQEKPKDKWNTTRLHWNRW